MKREGKGRISSSIISAVIMTDVTLVLLLLLRSTVQKTILAISMVSLFIFFLSLILCNGLKLKRIGKVILYALLSFVSTVLLSFVIIYFMAPSCLFSPSCNSDIYLKVSQLEQAEPIEVESSSGIVRGWFLHFVNERAPLIIYYTGNGETASRRAEYIFENQCKELFDGYNIVICSYPGYEYSDGTPSDRSLKDMGLSVFDAMSKRDDVKADKIYIWGFSIGTGVANYVAANRPVAGLLLLAPYSNGFDLYNRFLPIFHGPLRMLMNYDMKAEEFAENIQVTPTILASVQDEIVSYSTSLSLSEKYQNGCKLISLLGLYHNDFWDNEESKKYIKEYFREELMK